jgi:hypothetical protein
MSEHKHNYRLAQIDLLNMYERCECGDMRVFKYDTAPPLTKEQAQILIRLSDAKRHSLLLDLAALEGGGLSENAAASLDALKALIAIAEQ